MLSRNPLASSFGFLFITLGPEHSVLLLVCPRTTTGGDRLEEMAMAAAENRRGGRVKGMFNLSCLSVSSKSIYFVYGCQRECLLSAVYVCALFRSSLR